MRLFEKNSYFNAILQVFRAIWKKINYDTLKPKFESHLKEVNSTAYLALPLWLSSTKQFKSSQFIIQLSNELGDGGISTLLIHTNSLIFTLSLNIISRDEYLQPLSYSVD